MKGISIATSVNIYGQCLHLRNVGQAKHTKNQTYQNQPLTEPMLGIFGKKKKK